jgi:hypothetical protein
MRELLSGEFTGPSVAGAEPRPGMTEKQWFDSSVKCGDLERSTDAFGAHPVVMAYRPCGASDWRVIRLSLMAHYERALQCNKCGLWTLVTMPGWKKESGQPVQG